MKLDPDVASAIGSITSGAVAIIAAVVAVFAWRTSVHSAKATAALTAIEKTRWHAELRPQFEASAQRYPGGLIGVKLALAGPPALHQLDGVVIALRGFTGAAGDDPGPMVMSQEPYQFHVPRYHPGKSDRRHHPGRTQWRTEPLAMTLTEGRLVLLEEVSGSRDYYSNGHPVMLTLECRLAGYDPWIVPLTIERIEAAPPIDPAQRPSPGRQ